MSNELWKNCVWEEKNRRCSILEFQSLGPIDSLLSGLFPASPATFCAWHKKKRHSYSTASSAASAFTWTHQSKFECLFVCVWTIQTSPPVWINKAEISSHDSSASLGGCVWITLHQSSFKLLFRVPRQSFSSSYIFLKINSSEQVPCSKRTSDRQYNNKNHVFFWKNTVYWISTAFLASPHHPSIHSYSFIQC